MSSEPREGARNRASNLEDPVKIFMQAVGKEAFVPPSQYLPEQILSGVNFRKDDKTGLAIFEKEARLFILNELVQILSEGGEVVTLICDDDNLKEANDKVSRDFGDAVITWGSCWPLHEISDANLSCRVIAVLPPGSPDETLVFFENPSPEDKEKLIALSRRLNEDRSTVNLNIPDNRGNPRVHQVSVSLGLAFSPQDNLKVMERRRRINNDGTPNLAPYTLVDLENDLALGLKDETRAFTFTIIEGLRQLADDNAHEAKATKQLESADRFLESLMGVSAEEFDKAIEDRFGGSRQSRVVMEMVNRERRLRYLPPE